MNEESRRAIPIFNEEISRALCSALRCPLGPSVDEIDSMLDQGADINYGRAHYHPLDVALQNASPAVVAHLCKRGALVRPHSIPLVGRFAADPQAFWQFFDILLQYGACFETMASKCLVEAFVFKQPDMMIELVRRGATVDQEHVAKYSKYAVDAELLFLAAALRCDFPYYMLLHDISFVPVLIASGKPIEQVVQHLHCLRHTSGNASQNVISQVSWCMLADPSKSFHDACSSVQRSLKWWGSRKQMLFARIKKWPPHVVNARLDEHRRKLDKQRSLIEQKRMSFIATTLIETCIGLQSLDLPALVLLSVVDHQSPCLSRLPTMHSKWQLISAIKHYRATQQHSMPN